MYTALSLLLIAFGAILLWAVNATVQGVNVNTVGAILLVVGIVGLFLDIVFVGRDADGNPHRRYPW